MKPNEMLYAITILLHILIHIPIELELKKIIFNYHDHQAGLLCDHVKYIAKRLLKLAKNLQTMISYLNDINLFAIYMKSHMARSIAETFGFIATTL